MLGLMSKEPGGKFRPAAPMEQVDVIQPLVGQTAAVAAEVTENEAHLEVVRLLHQKGAEFLFQDLADHPLVSASRNGHNAVVEYYLNHGADINLKSKQGWSPLFFACQANRVATAEVLLARAAAVNATADDGSTPLHVASLNGHSQLVEILLNHGANPNIRNGRSFTALAEVCRTGRVDIAEILLLRGADANIRRGGGFLTPFQVAIENGHVEIVRLLYQNGENLSFHARSNLLTTACNFGRTRVVEYFLDNDIDVNRNDWSPLHAACMNGHAETAEFLLARGADVNAAADEGLTSLHVAGNRKVADLLLRHSANVDARNDSNQTPLHTVSVHGSSHVAKLLVQRGADLEARDADELTPLLFAAVRGKLGTVITLVEAGAELGATVGAEKWTVLDLAVSEGKLNVVRWLFQYTNGAGLLEEEKLLETASWKGHLDVVDFLIDRRVGNIDFYRLVYKAARHGRSAVVELLVNQENALLSQADRVHEIADGFDDASLALIAATRNGHVEIMRVLLDNGVAVDSWDSKKMTPLHVACAAGQLEAVKLLLEAGADMRPVRTV